MQFIPESSFIIKASFNFKTSSLDYIPFHSFLTFLTFLPFLPCHSFLPFRSFLTFLPCHSYHITASSFIA